MPPNPFLTQLTSPTQGGGAAGGGLGIDPSQYLGLFNALATQMGGFQPYQGQWQDLASLGIAPPDRAIGMAQNRLPTTMPGTPGEPAGLPPFGPNPFDPSQRWPAPNPHSFAPPSNPFAEGLSEYR